MSKPPNKKDDPHSVNCRFCGNCVDDFFELEVQVMTTGKLETWNVCDTCYDYMSHALVDDDDDGITDVEDLLDEPVSGSLFGRGISAHDIPKWRVN